jgi:hypothetical protein
MGMSATIHAMTPGTMPDGELIDSVDLGKCWHAIHFLLSGTADAGDDPSRFLLSGARMPDISDAEVFQNSVDEVRRFAAFLESVSTSTLLGRCDSRRAGELGVYNYDFLEAEGHDHIVHYVNKLREFTSRHAKRGHDLLVVIA